MAAVGAPVDLGRAVQAQIPQPEPRAPPDPGALPPLAAVAWQPAPRAPPGPGPLPPLGPVVLPQPITANDFADPSGYAMKYDIFQTYKPYLSGLSPPKQSSPELPQKKEKLEETQEENKPVNRFDNIRDDDFLEQVGKVTDQVKGKDGASKKKDAIQKAAKEFWNSHLGKKINYGELKAVLTAAVSN
uniref:Uncharacterized protein n=1 Tax=viral metagenome TaxID=1070528 RepID=A0A6C0JHK9_9ZZZZ